MFELGDDEPKEHEAIRERTAELDLDEVDVSR